MAATIIVVRKGRKFIGIYLNRSNASVEAGLSDRMRKASGCTSASVRGVGDGSIRELLTNDLRGFNTYRELRTHFEDCEFKRRDDLDR